MVPTIGSRAAAEDPAHPSTAYVPTTLHTLHNETLNDVSYLGVNLAFLFVLLCNG